MRDQRLLTPHIDPIIEAGTAHKICSGGWILALGDIQGENLASLHSDH
jgi:hypothetical protein